MSTRKDATKTSSTKKKVTDSQKASSTRTARDSSTDRYALNKKAPSRSRFKAAVDAKQSTSQPTVTPRDSSRTNTVEKKKITGGASKEKVSSNSLSKSSTRVTKTQYFPSKDLYSNALKHSTLIADVNKSNAVPKTSSHGSLKHSPLTADATKSKTVPKTASVEALKQSAFKTDGTKSKRVPLKTSSVKHRVASDSPKTMTKGASSVSSPDTSWSVSERPGTATLRKGSMVNENIVGPEAPPLVVKSPPNDYEDDFDSYESDFEKCSSSSENSSELPPTPSAETSSISSGDDLVQAPPATTEGVRSAELEKKLDSGTFELRDFKHRQLLQNIQESIAKENAKTEATPSWSDEGFEEQKSLQFINFLEARKKCERMKASELRRKRGEEILSMIRMDCVNFTIFELPSMPYETFIRNYGSRDGIQMSTQTGEDDVSEETQTEFIEVNTKWTQFPAKFSKLRPSTDEFWTTYKCEYRGVGSDEAVAAEEVQETDDAGLEIFLKISSDLVLELMAEDNLGNLDKLNRGEPTLPFSDGYVKFNTNNDLLKDSQVQHVSIYPKSWTKVLTVHVKTHPDEGDVRTVLCLWDISNYDIPQMEFTSFGEVCCATFAYETFDFVFGGESDGSILVWNVKEKSKTYDVSNRTPTCRTPIGQGHGAKVVSVRYIEHEQSASECYFTGADTMEVCSLDEEGVFMMWTLFAKTQNEESTVDDVTLIKTSTVDLLVDSPNLRCTDFILVGQDVYVTTDQGSVFYYVTNGARNKTKQFEMGQQCEATCLDGCPFSRSVFVAGFSSGDLSLLSTEPRRPLMTLSSPGNDAIQLVQWSTTKPFVLYAKDSSNTIHVWDLSKSDIYPELSLPFPETVTCFRLSPVLNVEDREMSYAVIGTEEGSLFLHLLNDNYGQDDYSSYKENVEIFLDYINRL
ncbi:cytoplasmic dynein 2 intermediate chain 1 [Cylas formicarius]|uniref:cytoplasmic dynein 2 intermediate chain 1 n=1 Tax=Cylas formicarius TaxID=197179 RepID=UPI002958A0C7|nr:cytoplasmic dynein 2 intermediate chain 1 [Cylas formicarius]